MVIFLSSQLRPRMFDETPNKEFPAEQSTFTVLFSNFPQRIIILQLIIVMQLCINYEPLLTNNDFTNSESIIVITLW